MKSCFTDRDDLENSPIMGGTIYEKQNSIANALGLLQFCTKP